MEQPPGTNAFRSFEGQLCFLGLSAKCSKELTGRFTNDSSEDHDPIDILEDFIFIIRDSEEYAYLESGDDYCSAARRFGMHDIFCTALSEPEFWELVKREPVWKWMSDFVYDKGVELLNILATNSGRYPMEIREEQGINHSVDGPDNPGEAFSYGGSEVIEDEGETKDARDDGDKSDEGIRRKDKLIEDDGEPPEDNTCKGDDGGEQKEEACEQDEEALHEADSDEQFELLIKNTERRAKNPDEFLMLYKGGLLARLQRFFDIRSELDTPRNPDAISSQPPTDLSANRTAVYLAEDESLARYYARFARRMDPTEAKVGVLTVWVDKSESPRT